MIALGFLGKEFVRWNKDAHSTHIFNPSAFSLAVFSIALIVTGTTHLTWGQEIATTLNYPAFIYIEIFLLGLVVQYLFSVTLVTLAAAASLMILNLVYTGATGVYWFLDSNIPIAVFLGLHLLVTDPSTSPRTDGGRVIFGVLYGAAVFALYGLLDAFAAPTFYDKLLAVPLLNLSIQWIDRIANRTGLQQIKLPKQAGGRRNLTHMSVWIALVTGMLWSGFVGPGHEGNKADFWAQACEQDLPKACRNLLVIHSNN